MSPCTEKIGLVLLAVAWQKWGGEGKDHMAPGGNAMAIEKMQVKTADKWLDS